MASQRLPHVSPPPDGASPAAAGHPVDRAMSATPFDYGMWSRLLACVVTPEGKVDYEALAARRDLLDRFVALLASASPDTAPERFPSEDHALAYWINAYNAFVLHAVMEEYPIRSVWKVKDGQFFDRRHHDAGGRVVSLNDIEHRILRRCDCFLAGCVGHDDPIGDPQPRGRAAMPKDHHARRQLQGLALPATLRGAGLACLSSAAHHQ